MIEHTHIEKTPYSPDKRLELDTAATMFPLAFCEKHKSLIRFKVTMNDMVDKNSLQLALDRLMPRFPSFYVRLGHDRFRYFLERLDCAPVILEESEMNEPLSMTLNDLGRCAFRIIAIENCIALEYSHAVSDGYGGSVFLKSLIAEYLNIRYALPISRFSGVLCVNESPTCDEIKDDYPRIAGSSYKVKDLSSAYSLRGTPDNALHITELTLKADELLRCAGGYGVTLTAFLSGVLVAAISDLRRYENREKEEIRLSIPVDLRRRFRSSTLRNFTLPTTVYAKEAGVSMDMPALCLSLGKQLKENINKETLSAMATPYVKMAKSRFVSGIPLFLKKWLVQTFFSLSKGGNCMTFSNLGVWRLPDEMKPYVRQCGIVLSPKSATPYSCGVISVGNTLTLSLTRNIKEPLLEQRVAKILNHFIYPLKTQWELIA